VFAFMPLIPIGSYRVKESFDGDAIPEIVGKVPLQWDQVLDGWRKTAISILVFIGVVIGFIWWEHLHGR
jgi:hypothetical protein